MNRQITFEKCKDKIYGAWVGKCAGGIIGAKQENNKSILYYSFDNVFPDVIPPNDDFDLQILYLQEVLEKQGLNFDANDLAREFCLHNMCWANEYRVAIKNIDGGIMPPSSGVFCNDYFKNSNGCPIRSELWGIIALGNPALACSFVEMDGCIDHTTESIETEKFFAALESEAFFEDDLIKLIDVALKYVDENSNVKKCAELIIREFNSGKPWNKTRETLIKKFGSSDASYAVVNMGIVLLSLLYGKGDFNDTMLTAVNCGYDTDCTSGTAGSILGIIKGKSGIDEAWLDKIGETFVVGTVDIVREQNNFTALTGDVFNFAYSASRDGLNNVRFVDVPKDYVCEVPKYNPFVYIKTEYLNSPTVSVNKQANFDIVIENKTGDEIIGKINLSDIPSLELKIEKEEVVIPPYGSAKVGGVASVALGEKGVNLRNKGYITFKSGERSQIVPIGFAGESKYRLYGPYFDNYDTEKYDHDVNGETMPIDLFSMFNGFVNINNEYVKGDNPIDEDCEIFYSAEDKLPVEKNVNYKGPCCVYLTKEFEVEKEEEIHILIGYSAPYKIWVNGELVAYSYGNNVCWMPLNNAVEIKLKKGKNRFVYKLLRTNGEFEFSVIHSKKLFGQGVLVDLINEI